MSRLYPFRGLSALVAIALPRWLRSRQEREPDRAFGGRPDSRRQHHGATPARAVRRFNADLQRRAADAVDRKRRHERRAHHLASGRSWHRLELPADRPPGRSDRASAATAARSYRLPAPLGAGYTYYWRTRAVGRRQRRPLLGRLELQRRAAGRDRCAGGRFTLRQASPRTSRSSGSPTAPSPERPASCIASRFRSRRLQQPCWRSSPWCRTAAASTTMTLGELPYKTTFYWRVRGSDGTQESPYSNTQSFTTPDPPAAPPGPAAVAACPVACPLAPAAGARTAVGLRVTALSVVQAVARANPGALSQLVPGAWRQLAVHGSSRRYAAHLRHALGLQRQARQRERSVAWTS